METGDWESDGAEPEPVAVNTQRMELPKIKTKRSELTNAEKEAFERNFAEKYRPAIQKWCDVYKGRVPLDPYEVTPEHFVERIGTQDRYREYIFVVNTITLGVRDCEAGVRVDYLNVPGQTRKMATLPDGTEAPVTTTPISKEQVEALLQADGGLDPALKMEIIPTGLSGSLNGGAMVHVGTDLENSATYKYDLVFGPDGKLAFYLKGAEVSLPPRN